MSNPIGEAPFEEKVIDELKSIGFEYLTTENLMKLRGGISTVIIEEHMSKYLHRKYSVSKDIEKKIFSKINGLHESDLITSNIAFMKILSEGVKIYDDTKKKTVSYKLIDFDDVNNNTFVVTNQFLSASTHPEHPTQIPDVVIFVNGLPIVVMELKAPAKSGDILSKAYQQIQNNQNYIPKLFTYNVFNVISNFDETRFGTITSSFSRYQFWRGSDFTSDTFTLFKSLFNKKTFLDVISKYIFYTEEQSPVKIVSSYHQYYGVRDLVKSSDNTPDNRGGIFWHTQGSGKSYSMLFYVKNYTILNPGTTFVVVTDRNDLDAQLGTTFEKAGNYISQKIHRVESINDLTSSLKDLKQDGVYFTTIQKFKDTVGKLSDRKDIVVITDEAHRSQNNIESTLELNSETGEVTEKFGNAKFIRDAFPNATFVGFTGTPIEKEDVSTSKIFGKVSTKYLMSDAERDGVVVPIKYESRNAKLQFDEEKLAELDTQGHEITKKLVSNSDLPSVMKKKVNRIVQSLQNFISDPDRVKGVASDFVTHYKERCKLLKGKAMFIALNRQTAVSYYKEIIKAAPELEKHIKVIITNSNSQTDTVEMIELAGSSKYRKDMAIEFKKPDSDFKIAIVVDMWLTGFDVPSLDLLYIDKPIKMHNLMQAVARTNRVFTDKVSGANKEHGLVIDYIGIWSQLNEALAYYSGKTGDDVTRDADVIKLKPEYLKRLSEHYNHFLSGVDVKVDSLMIDANARFDFIMKSHNVLARDKNLDAFVRASTLIKKQYNVIVGTLTKEEKIKFQMIDAIKSRIIQVELAKIDFRDIKKQLLSKLNESIKYDHTLVLDEVEGKAISLSDIIDFIKKDEPSETEHVDIQEKIAATGKLIKEMQKINITMSRKMSETLKKLLEKYDANHITLEELKTGIFIMVKEAGEASSSSGNEKYSPKELALFQILSMPVKEIPEFDKKVIEKIMNELLVIVNDDSQINQQWAYNNTMKKKVRGKLFSLLLENDYPPELAESSAKDVIEQIEYQRDYTRS